MHLISKETAQLDFSKVMKLPWHKFKLEFWIWAQM